MAKRSTSRYYQQYMRERRRIQRFISAAKKRGYSFDYSLPSIPKKITEKSVERLSKVKPETLYGKARYVSPYTGEITTGKQGRIQERQIAVEKRRATIERKKHYKDFRDYYTPDISAPTLTSDEVLRMVEQKITNFTVDARFKSNYQLAFHQSFNNSLRMTLQDAIDDEGREAVAERLQQQGAEEIASLIEKVQYDSKQETVQTALVQFATIIKGSSLTPHEAERIQDYAEFFENYEEV